MTEKRILKHKKRFGPIDEADGDAVIIPLTDYTNKSKKKPTIFDREDEAMKRSGFSIISEETYWPAGEDH